MVVNPACLTASAQKHLRTALLENKELPHVVLEQFFTPEFYHTLRSRIQNLPFTKNRQPLMHSYDAVPFSSALCSVFFPPPVLAVLRSLLGIPSLVMTATAYRLTWKHYRILHDSDQERAGIDLVLDFSDRWPSHAGGEMVYASTRGDVYALPIQGNCLTIVRRPSSFHPYFRYVNHYGRGHQRFFVVGTGKV